MCIYFYWVILNPTQDINGDVTGFMCLSPLLQDDDAVNAEAFINKASFLVSNSQHEVLNLQYKVGTWQ